MMQASHFLQVAVRPREEEKNKGGVSSLQKEETQKREEVSSKHDGLTALLNIETVIVKNLSFKAMLNISTRRTSTSFWKLKMIL